jgi:hypothetical protein
MGLFSRRDKIMDLTEEYHYNRKHAKAGLKEDTSKTASSTPEQENSGGGFFSNFFGSSNVSSNTSSGTVGDIGNTHQGNFDSETGKPLDSDEKKRRLAMRLKNMTDRIEEQANQIYQMQHRIELLEKKINTRNYE